MTEIHLKQWGFKYSTCGLFTKKKSKKEYETLKK